MYLLKNVEIVIIVNTAGGGSETAGFKGIGKPVAHILCAVFAGRGKLCNSIPDFCGVFCGAIDDLWRPREPRTADFSDIGVRGSLLVGDGVEIRTPIGPDCGRKNQTV